MSDSQKYDRQKLIPGWDQDVLSNSKVAVVGAGALGNHVCLGLIGLGIGTIKIYDFDDIEPHNLNRQSLFCEEDIGKNKAEVLAYRLKERNSSLIILGINEKIEEETIDMVLRDVDVIVDCVDLIRVRRILNRYCLWEDIPLVHGGISWRGGQTGIITRKTPCVNCIFPKAIQERELEVETSCINKPDPSVVYISQILAGLMVYNVRRVILPLKTESALSQLDRGAEKASSSEFALIKLDFNLINPFYMKTQKRKSDCECVEILKEVAPEILEKERSEKESNDKEETKELKKLLNSE